MPAARKIRPTKSKKQSHKSLLRQAAGISMIKGQDGQVRGWAAWWPAGRRLLARRLKKTMSPDDAMVCLGADGASRGIGCEQPVQSLALHHRDCSSVLE